MTLLLAVLLGVALPILPAQVLWVNMVSSVALALVLAFEPTEADVMQRPPRPVDEPMLSRFLVWRIAFVSLLFMAGVFGMFEWALWHGASVDAARTVAVNTLVCMEVFYLFSVRYLKAASFTWSGVRGTPRVLASVATVFVLQLLFTYTPREVARRFNHLYGRGGGFEQQVAAALARFTKDDQRYCERQRKAYGETGSHEAWAKGEALVRRNAAGLEGWTEAETELLLGHLKGSGRSVLVKPQARHTEVATLPGLDGAKMSKSYGNAILMRDEPEVVAKKVRGMATDSARVRRTDPGEPEKCPVWQFHKVYSDDTTREWVAQGCRSAGIGCLDCKQPVIDAIVAEQTPWRARAAGLLAEPKKVHWIVENGTEHARTVARQTMKDVRQAMGLAY